MSSKRFLTKEASLLDLPPRQFELLEGYEWMYLDFPDFQRVANLLDSWGLLYAGFASIEACKSVGRLREDLDMANTSHAKELNKIRRQLAREPFFTELQTKTIFQMSANVRFVAEYLVQIGEAVLVII